MSLPKYVQVAESIRVQIADGTLLPGDAAPSGAALSRVTGYSCLTCRKALSTLIEDGVLVPGVSRNARPRVPCRAAVSGEQILTNAARVLSVALGARRRAVGLTQPQLAMVTGMSVTTIGHAETGRLWQSRRFWELADKAVGAGGELLALQDTYRAAAVSEGPAEAANLASAETAADVLPAVAVTASGPVTCVAITWADGAVTTVYPPQTRGGQHESD